jgi:hypothetical protein
MPSRQDSSGRRSSVSLTPHDDEGSIVVGWMTKLAAAAAIIGVMGFDAISIGVGHLTTTDDAGKAAQAASQAYQSHHDIQAAYTAAAGVLGPHEQLSTKGFVILPDGTATVTVVNTVKTLLLERTKQTKSWAVVTVSSTGKYTGS